jgi:hypothetical protein
MFMHGLDAPPLEGDASRSTSPNMKQAPMLLLAGLALMACTPSEPAQTATTETPATTEPATPPAAEPAPPPADPAADTCNMAQYTTLVGKPATDATVPPASSTVRHIRPDTQVTMDFQATRLNIDINAEGVITGIRCG